MWDEPGLPTLGMMMVISGVVLGVTTNRKFGHKTFHSPSPHEPITQCSSQQRTLNSNKKGGIIDNISNTSRNSSRSTSCSTSRSSGFEGLPDSGVFEVMSFLSPADLAVNTAAVSTGFCRASGSESLWRRHCERMESQALPLGEAWRLAQQQRHQHRHQQHQVNQQEKEEAHILQQVKERSQGGAATAQQHPQCCSSVDSIGSSLLSLRARWRFSFRRRLSFPSGGVIQQQRSSEPHPSGRSSNSSNSGGSRSSDRLKPGDTTPPSPRTSRGRGKSSRSKIRALPSSLSLSSSCSCCGFVYGYYSWREAFLRAHRAKPKDLLQELSSLAPSPHSSSYSSSVSSSTPRPCIVVLHGKVHDLTEFLPSHPGGALILQEHSATDATQAFERWVRGYFTVYYGR